MTTTGFLRVLACALTAALLAVPPACSDDGNADDAADTDTTAQEADDETVDRVAQALMASPDSPLDDDSATCAARILVADLGAGAALETAEAGGSDTLGDEQEASAVRALDDCVPGKALAAQVLDGFWEGAGATPIDSAELEDCVGARLDGRVGELMATASGPEGTTDTIVEALDQCLTPDDLGAFMAESLVRSGFSPDDAQCISDQMKATLGLRDLVAMGSGTLDPAVQAEIGGSATRCGIDAG